MLFNKAHLMNSASFSKRVKFRSRPFSNRKRARPGIRVDAHPRIRTGIRACICLWDRVPPDAHRYVHRDDCRCISTWSLSTSPNPRLRHRVVDATLFRFKLFVFTLFRFELFVAVFCVAVFCGYFPDSGSRRLRHRCGVRYLRDHVRHDPLSLFTGLASFVCARLLRSVRSLWSFG